MDEFNKNIDLWEDVWDTFDQKQRLFEKSVECFNNMEIIFCFVKGFWDLHGEKTIAEGEKEIHLDLDYWEGEGQGWEIIFKRDQDVYDRLKPEFMRDICPEDILHQFFNLELELPTLYDSDEHRNQLIDKDDKLGEPICMKM